MVYKLGKVTFGSLNDKENWILQGVIHSLEYIGKESRITTTENALRKLAIKDLKKLIKSKH